MTKATATLTNVRRIEWWKNASTKRPFVTQYFAESDASGKLPVSVGYAASIKGARRNMAVRLVLGEYGLAVVVDRASRDVMSVMRRTKLGMTIKDTPEGESK